ncbi:MAG: hypothetical protein LBL09_01530 [Oscillospiraceae bacterium]|jgi:hypothetical protein|nr:hypothetical protein [Oscillospiraceae bacterium]
MKKILKLKINRGYIYGLTRKNVFMLLFWALLLFGLYCWYMSSAGVYFLNAFTSGYTLDSGRLWDDAKLLEITEQTEYFNTGEYGVTLPPMLRLDEVYRDGNKYRFKVEVESYRELGIAYSAPLDAILAASRYDPARGDVAPPDAVQKVAMVTIDGKNVVALMPVGETLTPGETVLYACFSELPLYIGHDMGVDGEAVGMEVASYCLELRYLKVDDEITDFFLVIVFSIIFPLFLLYTVLCFVKPQLHPNYLRIHKFGEINKICAEIDEEIKDNGAYKEGRSVYTKQYIIYHSLHATKVTMNHKARN